MTASMSASDRSLSAGIFTLLRIAAGLRMNCFSATRFQYSVTLAGTFSSGPTAPPETFTEGHAEQCFVKTAGPAFAAGSSSGTLRSTGSVFEAVIVVSAYGHGRSAFVLGHTR